MSDLITENSIEPVIDFTRPQKNVREPVIDFTGERKLPVKKVPETKITGVVGRKNESALARMAKAKSLRLALAVLGTSGTLKAVASDMGLGQESADSDVSVSQMVSEVETPEQKISNEDPGHFDEIFHDLDAAQYQQTRETVDDFKNRIFAKSNYVQAHRNIPIQYKNLIEQTAKMYGISPDTLMGIISVENGGGPSVLNESSGALGVAQFLPDTARQYGLLVNSEFDERKIPEKSIPAAGKYLEVHKNLFGGDEGLAIWSYHAGVGNVFDALRVYYLDTYQIDIGDYVGAIVANDPVARENVEKKLGEMMKRDGTDVSKVLFNDRVQEQVVSHLDDYSGDYVFAVAAAAELLHEYNESSSALAAVSNVSR